MPAVASGAACCAAFSAENKTRPTLTSVGGIRHTLKNDAVRPSIRMGVFMDGRMTTRHYLTVEEVAKQFGVNVTTVYRLVKQGKLPAFKVGNQWRFSEVRLEEWVANRERVG